MDLNVESRKCSEHKHFGVSKVNKSEYAVHHGVSKRDQRIDKTQSEPLQCKAPELARDYREIHINRSVEVKSVMKCGHFLVLPGKWPHLYYIFTALLLKAELIKQLRRS